MYTYAFLKTPAVPLELPLGIENAVQICSQSQLAAVVEPDISLEELKDDKSLMQAVFAHDRVIRKLFLQTTILPLRFGTSFLSLQGLLAHLDANQQDYLEKLTQFEGKAEYFLKFIPLPLPETPVVPITKGKEYFLAKKKQYQTQMEVRRQQQNEIDAIKQTIAQAYPEFMCDEAQGDVETIYLLTEHEKEFKLYQAIRVWQTLCSSWQINLGEALPPYHFLGN